MGSNAVCITRPCRFGKTVTANMIASFFGKGHDSHAVFDTLKIAGSKDYEQHINHYNVIHIVFNEVPHDCKSYQMYIERIRRRLIKDFIKAYPDHEIDSLDAVWDILKEIHEYEGQDKFIFVLDEWDFIFHQDFVTYMTGILPIAKYSSSSELNMFLEYSMASVEKYSEYFGFTDDEVDDIFNRYLNNCKNPAVTREGLRLWYDGY